MVLLVVPNETGELELYINLETLNPNLGGWGGGNFTTPSWLSLNNSKTVKAVTLKFCSIL